MHANNLQIYENMVIINNKSSKNYSKMSHGRNLTFVFPQWFMHSLSCCRAVLFECSCTNLNAALCAGLLLLCLGSSGLELNPSAAQVVLSINSSFSITCSGWSDVTWRFKREENVPEFHTEKRSSSSSVLSLERVTWRHTGVYVCSENGTDENREVAVFVPGKNSWKDSKLVQL